MLTGDASPMRTRPFECGCSRRRAQGHTTIDSRPLEQHERCSPLATALGKFVLKVMGWQLAGEPPPARRLVVIAAPHTSNVDFVYLLAAAWSFGLRIRWLGKRELFRFPVGAVMRGLGGIAVDRSGPNNLVTKMQAEFESREAMTLVVPPSGTRGRAPHWKSGFYRIAEAAGATLLCSKLDYGRKTATLGEFFVPSGDIGADMDRIRDAYEGIQGRHPEMETPIRLAEETPAKPG